MTHSARDFYGSKSHRRRPIQAFVVGQPLTSEILGILEDYDVTEVQFLEEEAASRELPAQRGTRGLLIVNALAVSPEFRRRAKRLARTRDLELLEFHLPTLRDV